MSTFMQRGPAVNREPAATAGDTGILVMTDHATGSGSDSEARVRIEMAFLGALMLLGSVPPEIGASVAPDDMFRFHHQHLYAAMLRLAEKNQPIDYPLLIDELALTGGIDSGGGAAYILALFDCNPSAANIRWYAERVKFYADRDRSHLALQEALASVNTADIDNAWSSFAKARTQLDRALAPISDAEGCGASDIVAEFSTEQAAREINPDAFRGIQTGFIALDRIKAGIQKSELVVIAARTGIGKSVLAKDITLSVARSGVPVGLFSFEMSKLEIMERMICSEASIDPYALRSARLTPDEYRSVANAKTHLSRLPFFIQDKCVADVASIVAQARVWIERHGVGLIVVDYLSLIQAERKNDNRSYEIGDITTGLKRFCMAHEVPVIALAQLNRESEKSDKPMLSHLADSDTIARNSNCVILLNNLDHKQRGEGDLIERVECMVEKNRGGKKGTVTIGFQPRYVRFVDVTDPFAD